jgi:rhodanese-related sulfurtransferase
MRTSDPQIYAGGDCTEAVSQVSGKKFYIPMGSLANRHGRVIAENIAGNRVEFPGAMGSFLVKVFDINIGAVGLSVQAAETAGIKAGAVWGTFPDKPDYYPESKVMTLKMAYESESGRIIGLQAIGAGDICRRIDTMSALMQAQATLDDVLAFEQGYAPPYSEAIDPLHHLAAMAQAQRANQAVFVGPGYELSDFGEDSVWLDVREAVEIETEPWPRDRIKGRLMTIPLNELRERLDELDKNAKFVIVCKRGPRSYQASVILRQAGFEDVQIVSGGYEAIHS